MRPWPERDPERHAKERAFWARQGFKEERYRPELPVTFLGTVTVVVDQGHGFERHPFGVRIEYPGGYPQLPPKVTFPDPRMSRGRHQSPLGGSPCLFPETAWDPDTSTIGDFHHALERWLRHYVTGHFPNELAIYELPEYFVAEALTVLTGAGTLAAFAGRDRGGFTITELLGRDLSVLRSVDSADVGSGLLSELWPKRYGGTKRVQGKWYRLPHEPVPMRWTAELAQQLAMAGHRLHIGAAPPRDRQLVGLVFNDAILDQERLLILDYGGHGRRDQPKPGHGWGVRAARVEVASHEEVFRRLQGVRDLDRLATARVPIFGVGAVGSRVAEALVREGLGTVGLYDPDVLKPGNVARHTLTLLDVGQFKAEAMSETLGRINPDLDTRPDTMHCDDPAVMEARVAAASLVVAAIGEDRREQLLADVILEQQKPSPLLIGRTLHAGSAWRAMLVRPGIDACLRCLAAYRDDPDSDWIHVPAAELPPVRDTGCSAASMPGVGLAAMGVATFVAARALDLLEARTITDNHWVWVERPISSARSSRLHAAPAFHAQHFPPRPDCPSCSTRVHAS